MDNIKIGKLISKLRKNLNLTQEELGNKIGVGFRAVSKWECGQTLPELSNMKELSKVFGITLDELLSGELKKKHNNSNKRKIIITTSSIITIFIILFLSIILTSINTNKVFEISSIEKDNYDIQGQITFTNKNIIIVINKVIFSEKTYPKTKIKNYEYSIISNDIQLIGYGYSPTSQFGEKTHTIQEFSNNFTISSSVESSININEFINNKLYLNINFIDENNQIINNQIELEIKTVK